MTDSDLTPLLFVDPGEIINSHRVVLWASPGEGKSVGAASAPTPIVVVSADRPNAYKFARRHHELGPNDLREVRYQGPQTLASVNEYLRENGDIKTVVLDPWRPIYEGFVDIAPADKEGGPNYQWINKQVTRFLYSLREFDVNVVIVAHEKLNDGKWGDGKLYPDLGGGTLINKILAEADIVAHVERVPGENGGDDEYIAQLKPVRNIVCKQSTPADLGARAPVNLTAWFAAAADDTSDLPFTGPGEVTDHEPEDEKPGGDGQQRLAA